jgi:hypothetical protein
LFCATSNNLMSVYTINDQPESKVHQVVKSKNVLNIFSEHMKTKSHDKFRFRSNFL